MIPDRDIWAAALLVVKRYSTDAMQAARRLYERNGYERCERYNRNPQATVFMSKRLGAG